MSEGEKPKPAKTLNINVGILGHVDSGKTSLSRALSTVGSTACFDKHPQSKERGITLDLGFSSFMTELPEQLVGQLDAGAMQITLVDCPGHASLIRTIIGGAQIIDLMILVIDVNKGIQTQTAECLVIGEITNDKMIIVLNKVDMIPEAGRAEKLAKLQARHNLHRHYTPRLASCTVHLTPCTWHLAPSSLLLASCRRVSVRHSARPSSPAHRW